MNAGTHAGSPSLQVDRVVMREIRLPLVAPFRSATGVVDARRVILLELRDADGCLAWSECVAESLPAYSPETVDTAWLAIGEWLAPRLVHGAAVHHGTVHALLGEGVRGHRMARASLEMGIWALASRRVGTPLAALIAGESHASRGHVAPRASIETGIVLGMQDSLAGLMDLARTAIADGYRRIKVKATPGQSVEMVRAMRDAIGDHPLAVDANCSYSLDDAGHVRELEALDRLGLTMIEQPLGAEDLVRHAALQRRLVTPVCLDESIVGVAAAEDMLTLQSGRMVNIKPGRVGGLAEAIAIHDRMASAGLPVWCGGMLETGIGRAYNVALAALPGFTEPSDLSPSARYWSRDVVTPEWTMDRAGRVTVPLGSPGIGVEVDAGYVDSLTVRSLVIGG